MIKKLDLETNMNIKKLKIQPDENFDNFKVSLLHALKLYDYNKNCLIDFDTRLKNYFNRNKDLKVVIEVDITRLHKTLYDTKFWKLDRYKQKIPENYPMGGSNMETQAYYDPIICDEKYYEDVERTQKEAQLEVSAILFELECLNRNENIEINIKQ